MNQRYALENLIKIFEEYSIESKKHTLKLIEEYKKNYPHEELPVHFKNDFCINLALKSICEEIIKIKEIDK